MRFLGATTALVAGTTQVRQGQRKIIIYRLFIDNIMIA
jgi:hypothetical protein